MEYGHVDHAIDPVFDERSRVLMLGTMPSPASREAGFFYGHPQNRFWRVLAAVFDEPAPDTIEDKRDLLLRRRIALWDVLASCDIEGASDASIRNARPNDLSRILDAADIQAVFATGSKAGQLYAKFCEEASGMPCTTLPSTSPANAKMKLGDLTEAYRAALLPCLRIDEPVTLSVPQVAALEQSIAASGTPLSALMRRAGRALAKYALDEFEAQREKKTTRTAAGYALDFTHTSDKANSNETNSPENEAELNLDEMDGHADATSTTCAAGAGQPSFERPSHERTSLERSPLPHVVVLCGSGNNGGDGWVAAEDLAQRGCAVRVITPCTPEDIKAEPAHEAAMRATAQLSPANILVAPAHDEFTKALAAADIIIDAILGTGFSGDAVREPYAAWIKAANERRAEGALTVAADVPSGLSAQTGKAADPCIKADLTVTMMTLKPGLVTPYAFAFCGGVRVAPIAYIEPHLPRILGDCSDEGSSEKEGPDAPAAAFAFGNTHNPLRTDQRTPGSEAPERKLSTTRMANSEFLRAEAEDDDGYNPYSDRRPEPEPLFERDPWA